MRDQSSPSTFCNAVLRIPALVCSVVFAAVMPAGAANAQPAPNLAPVLSEHVRNAIPGQYVVVFKQAGSFNSVEGRSRQAVALVQSLAAQKLVARFGGKVGFQYHSALVGFSARLPAVALRVLRAAPGVDYIEPDQKYAFVTVQPPNPPGAPPTGIDRTSERLGPLDGKYTYSLDGTGVHVYVIDSGIWIAHTEFGVRATSDFSVVAGSLSDCLGHGTHVAGTIGGTTYGIAKNVFLHSVRVGDATCTPTTAAIISGVDWVTNDVTVTHPGRHAVANVSIGGPVSAAIDTAVTNSIAANVTYVVAAGNSGADACNASPAHIPAAITVGAIDPANDTRPAFSNFGTCLDLFAPGVNIVSAMPDGLAICPVVSNAPGSRSQSCSGTSMASPHVAGVAALVLQNNNAATPAQVWTAILAAADVTGTPPAWGGVLSAGAGSPNVLLHWGSGVNGMGVHDGYNDGDPHLVTVDGTHYNFQGAGEYVYLRDGGGTEIQTRETPVQTASSFLGPDPYDGIASCVSLNTAVAARVGSHRVTFQPNLSGVPDPSGMQLRVDGIVKALSAQGLNLPGGGRIVPSPAGHGVEIDFPDGTVLVVTANWWGGQSLWYLNVDVFHTPASAGIMGAIASGSWLPELPSGVSVGAMPAAVPDRYTVLYQKFGNAWRVTNASSLFDYKPGTSTNTFTVPSWPLQSPPCMLPKSKTPPAKAVDVHVAQEICGKIDGKTAHADCVFDVMLTGEKGFAKAYADTLRLKSGGTITTVIDKLGGGPNERLVEFIATVTPAAADARGAPRGAVQFSVDGKKFGDPVSLNENGQALWRTKDLKVLDHDVGANFMPSKDNAFLPSSGVDQAKRATFD
jgi:subtilisin family serine protease